MRWTPNLILEELTRLHLGGESLSYRALARRHRALVSAAAYHFGSFRFAVERAGFSYADVSRRPQWTKERVIRQIKAARRSGMDLSWTAVVGSDGPLKNAAFAAVQKRMFRSWARALEAAGVDSDNARRYLSWDSSSVTLELKQRHADGKPMNSGAVQKAEPSLHAAAIRYFGSYDRALTAARLSVRKIRRRQKAKAH